MNEPAENVSQLHEVRATFNDSAKMQGATDKLMTVGFDRAELSLPTPHHSLDEAAPETAAKPASSGSDAQQARTLGSSTAAAAAAMAAVGITVATGGAAIPAVAAAVLAGGAVGGATFAATGAATNAEQKERNSLAAADELVLSVRVMTTAKRDQAVEILRAAGATNVQTIGA